MRYFLLFFLITIAFNVSAAPLQEGFTDDNSPVVIYSGAWIDGVYTEAYGGGYQRTTDFSANVSFDTFATGVTIFFVYDPQGDDIEICVELDCTIVSTLGATAIGSVELTGLVSATKTISISKLSNDLTVFNFDAVYIHPNFSSQDLSEASQQYIAFQHEGADYTGVLDLRITSGDAIIVLLLSFVLTVYLFQFIVGLWRK